jgi:hypothetical protein
MRRAVARPEDVAKMLGHVDTEMIRKHYAPWVKDLDLVHITRSSRCVRSESTVNPHRHALRDAQRPKTELQSAAVSSDGWPIRRQTRSPFPAGTIWKGHAKRVVERWTTLA